MKAINKYLRLVKFSHTIFAMPFALVGYFLGVAHLGAFSFRSFALVIVAMVLARTSAMGFNRIVDRRFDAANPRTASREIPSGEVSLTGAWSLVVASILGFVVVAGLLNPLCLWLSPVALVVILGYSLTKRFTSLCHLVLGVGLGIAPVAAYIAVTGEFSTATLSLGFLVMSWCSGFDIIFALQDVEFDRSQGLNSIPAKLGIRNGLILSALLHAITFALVIAIGLLWLNSTLYWIGATLFSALLVFQHIIVKPSDLSRVNLAFGTTNGMASLLYGLFTILSLYIQ